MHPASGFRQAVTGLEWRACDDSETRTRVAKMCREAYWLESAKEYTEWNFIIRDGRFVRANLQIYLQKYREHSVDRERRTITIYEYGFLWKQPGLNIRLK
jgi:hypothetical protein